MRNSSRLFHTTGSPTPSHTPNSSGFSRATGAPSSPRAASSSGRPNATGTPSFVHSTKSSDFSHTTNSQGTFHTESAPRLILTTISQRFGKWSWLAFLLFFALLILFILSHNSKRETSTSVGAALSRHFSGLWEWETDGYGIKIVGYCKNVSMESVEEIPDKIGGRPVRSIGENALIECNLKSLRRLPSGLVEIGDWAFKDCSALALTELPSGLAKIGKGAFFNCASLSLAELPSKLAEIGEGAFLGCASIDAFHLSAGNASYQTIDGVLYSKSGDELLAYPSGRKNESFEVPQNATRIGACAFAGNKYLENVICDNGLIEIGEKAFYRCESLNALHISSDNKIYRSVDGVLYSKSGDKLLLYPNGRKDVSFEIPQGATKIGDYAFRENKYLEKVICPAGLITIGANAFEDCASLTSVELPTELAEIGDYAFQNCSSLSLIELPSSLTKIGGSAFFNCSSLSLTELPSGLVEICSWAFKDCSSLSLTELPPGLIKLGDEVFQNCELINALHIAPDNKFYQTIDGVLYSKSGNELFFYPSGRKDVSFEIPSNVIAIKYNAFSGNKFLEKVILSPKLVDIGHNAFGDCESIKEFSAPSDNPRYQTIDGILYSKLGNELVLYPRERKDVSFEIPQSVKKIGPSAFEGNKSLEKVIFPPELTYIGPSAFKDCASLALTELPAGLAEISMFAFDGCESLVLTELPAGLVKIGHSAFKNCKSLPLTELPAELTEIEFGAFSGCESLSLTKLPPSLTKIEDYAFSGCSSCKFPIF